MVVIWGVVIGCGDAAPRPAFSYETGLAQEFGAFACADPKGDRGIWQRRDESRAFVDGFERIQAKDAVHFGGHKRAQIVHARDGYRVFDAGLNGRGQATRDAVHTRNEVAPCGVAREANGAICDAGDGGDCGGDFCGDVSNSHVWGKGVFGESDVPTVCQRARRRGEDQKDLSSWCQ